MINKKYKALIHVGISMSNILYNLSQKDKLFSVAQRECFKLLQQKWDKELSALNKQQEASK